MRSLIISLFLVFNCHSALALDMNDADRFGDDFITAMQKGESVNFIPDKFHLETFLYNAFGEDYLQLTPDEIDRAKASLANSMKILHSSPILVEDYRQMKFLETRLQQIDNDYVYTFISQIPGDHPRKYAIYIKEIEGKTWIVDFKSSYWLTESTGQMYQSVKQDISIPELMKMMEDKYKEQFGG